MVRGLRSITMNQGYDNEEPCLFTKKEHIGMRMDMSIQTFLKETYDLQWRVSVSRSNAHSVYRMYRILQFVLRGRD